MNKLLLTILSVVVASAAWAQALSADAQTVVTALKAKHPDTKALCALGPDGIRKEMMGVLMPLVGQRKIQSDPMSVGTEAGGALRAECEKLRQAQ